MVKTLADYLYLLTNKLSQKSYYRFALNKKLFIFFRFFFYFCC